MDRRRDGFSLVEVLVALTVIGFVALAVAPMFTIASRSNRAAAHTSTCSALAMERLERLRADALATLSAGGSLTADTPGYVDTTQAHFVVRWRISDLADPPGGKRIDVRAVSLRGSIGPPKQVTLSTLRVP